jgi:predicted transcriptional regulator
VKLREVIEVLAAEALFATDAHLELKITAVAASDLMSDILARARTPDLMLTGLATPQAVRTASVASVPAVMIVRGKTITPQMIALAEEDDIPLMATRHSLYGAAGLLWSQGLRSGLEPE